MGLPSAGGFQTGSEGLSPKIQQSLGSQIQHLLLVTPLVPPALATWAQEVHKCKFTDDAPQDRWEVPGLGAAKEPLQTGHPTSDPSWLRACQQVFPP